MIAAAPVRVRDLQQRLQPNNVCDGAFYDENKVAKLNQKATEYGQFSTNNGVIYQNMQLRNDLLDFQDSDEETIEEFLDFEKKTKPAHLDMRKTRPKTQHGHHVRHIHAV